MKATTSPSPHNIPTRSEAERVSVEEIMSTDIVPLAEVNPIAIPANANVAQAAAIMTYEQLAVLPVVDAQGRTRGSITADDLLRWIAASAGYITLGRNDR